MKRLLAALWRHIPHRHVYDSKHGFHLWDEGRCVSLTCRCGLVCPFFEEDLP